MKTSRVNLLTSICSIVEENNSSKYKLLDSIVELLNDDQINQIEDIIVNQFSEV